MGRPIIYMLFQSALHGALNDSDLVSNIPYAVSQGAYDKPWALVVEPCVSNKSFRGPGPDFSTKFNVRK